MARSEAGTSASDRLLELVGRLERHDGFDQVVAGLKAGQGATLDGVWGSSCALCAAALAGQAPASLVVISASGSCGRDSGGVATVASPVEG